MSKPRTASTHMGGLFAPLENIAAAHSMLETLMSRAPGLPGIGALYGESGLGKTFSAAYLSNPNSFGAAYVSCRAYETSKSLAESISRALGLNPRGTIAQVVDEIINELGLSQRPLVIDEIDRIVEGRSLELVRDLHDHSNAAVVLIGEERFPAKLKRNERFDNRVLVWQPAVRCTAADLDKLARHYTPKLELDAELKKRVLQQSAGVTRRVVVNLEAIKRWAESRGTQRVTGDEFDGELYTGQAPRSGGSR